MDHSDRKTTTPISPSSISSAISNSINSDSTPTSITAEPTSQLATAPLINSPSITTSTASNNSSNIQRPLSTPYNDKHLKDFSLHQFNRNLTIEKANFEPSHQSHLPSPLSQQQQTSRTVPSPQQDSHHTTITTAQRPDTRDSTLVDTADTDNASTAYLPSSKSTQAQAAVQQPPTQTHNQRGQYNTFMTSSPTKIPENPLNSTTKWRDAIPHSPPRTTLANNKAKPTMKNEAEKQPNKKKNRKLPGGNGTATPSEVFHRNLVDAVSNVEDSDEHEQYVYPYSHHDPSTTATKNRNQQKNRNHPSYGRTNSPSIASAPGSSLSLHHPRSTPAHSQHNSTGSLLRYSTDGRQGHAYKHQHSPPLLPLPPQQQQQQQQQQDYYRYGTKYQQQPAVSPMADEERGPWMKRDYQRPKLRSHVMDHNALPQPWAHEVSSSDDEEDDEMDDDDNYRHHSPYNEQMHLLRHSQRRHPRTGMSCTKVLRNTCVSVFVFIVVMVILTVYRALPLTDVSASMEHILASDKELIFDLKVRANNWNWWQIRIQQGDLSVFAFSQLVPPNITFGVDPAEYLGSFQSFDQPLSFMSSAILGPHRQANASAQIRIKSPGADLSGNQRWSRMIRYPFGLVIRGVLNYRPLPLFNLSPRQSIPLCILAYIDPISLTSPSPSISYFSYNDPEHGYCSHFLPVSPTL